MTEQEMNEFLESIGGLKNGFYTDREPITSASFFTIGLGWYPLVKKLIEDLIKVGWDKQICQVKEKFGGLRFYVNSLSEKGHKLISKAEEESFEICEECGEPGEIRSREYWVKTLCDKDAKQWLNET